ncbi:MAG TPA: hypothetical protein VF817_00630, partial [Patescibacteria group bacterium]
MKAKKILLIISIAIAWQSIFSTGHASAATEISSNINTPTTWTKAGSPYIVLGNISVNAPFVIEPGVVVKVRNSYANGFTIKNSFTAVGTPLDKIVFTTVYDSSYGGNTRSYYSDQYSNDWKGIYVLPGQGQAKIENAKIFYGEYGIKYSTIDRYSTYKDLSVRNTEIRYSSSAGIYLRYTQPTMENLVLANNYYGLYVYQSTPDKIPVIKNSSIFGNNPNGAGVAGYYNPFIDARYNWWGDSSGPFYYSVNGKPEASNLDGKGNRIFGQNVLFRPWDQTDPTIPKEPVIFVPGIGASINPDLMIGGLFSNKWTMFDHTYDGMIEALKSMGYIEGKTLFIGYYDWRKSNEDSARDFLKPLIDRALNLNPEAYKVNIVAHSMGGLVSRSYVQSPDYRGDVDNLIMIATPNHGSSDVYATWEGGSVPGNWELVTRTLMNVYLSYMSVKKLTFSNYETVHRYIPSVKQLMPLYDYVYKAGNSGDLKNYSSMHETNDFLAKLNNGMDLLNQRAKISIIIGDKQPTVGTIPVVDSDKEGIWQDGKPEPIDPQKNVTNGDGEVLKDSVQITNKFSATLDSNHRGIVTDAEPIVAQLLNEKLEKIHESPQINDELVVWSDGSNDMTITAPDGQKVSQDGGNIHDARFAGESKKNGFKIVSVPNPKNGNYNISVKGGDSSDVKIGIEHVDHTGNGANSSSNVSSEVQPDQTVQYVVSVDQTNIQNPVSGIIEQDSIAPVINIESPKDGEKYQHDLMLPIKISTTDDSSKPEEITIQALWDGMFELDLKESVDLKQQDLGEHIVKVVAVDKLGNKAEKTSTFQIVEISPVGGDSGSGSGNGGNTDTGTSTDTGTNTNTNTNTGTNTGDQVDPNQSNGTNNATGTNPVNPIPIETTNVTSQNVPIAETAVVKSKKHHHKKKSSKKKKSKRAEKKTKTGSSKNDRPSGKILSIVNNLTSPMPEDKELEKLFEKERAEMLSQQDQIEIRGDGILPKEDVVEQAQIKQVQIEQIQPEKENIVKSTDLQMPVLGKLTDQILNNKGLVLGVSTEKNEQPDRSKTKPLQESSLNYPLLGS